MRVALLFLLSCLGFSFPAHAGLDEGIAAFESGDHDTALREFEPLARAGRIEAMLWLARVHDEGLEAPDAALPWYQKAAARGNAEAQLRLGDFHAEGIALPQDADQARLWYGKAAAQGNEDAMFALGVLHQDELGDVPEAARWFGKAAERGHAEAQYRFGLLLLGEAGLPKDESRAWLYLTLAAEAEVEDAQTALDVLELRLKPAQRAEAAARLEAWRKAHP